MGQAPECVVAHLRSQVGFQCAFAEPGRPRDGNALDGRYNPIPVYFDARADVREQLWLDRMAVGLRRFG